MSESPVNASHVEEIVTQVLTQLVQDGDDELKAAGVSLASRLVYQTLRY